MSEHAYPAITCDHEDGCDEFALDHTLGGLVRVEGSNTHLPDGWSGARPGDNGEHYCQRHTQERVIMCETPRGCTCGAPADTPRGMHHDECAVRP